MWTAGPLYPPPPLHKYTELTNKLLKLGGKAFKTKFFGSKINKNHKRMEKNKKPKKYKKWTISGPPPSFANLPTPPKKVDRRSSFLYFFFVKPSLTTKHQKWPKFHFKIQGDQ